MVGSTKMGNTGERLDVNGEHPQFVFPVPVGPSTRATQDAVGYVSVEK